MLAALKATLGGGAPAADGHDAAVARGLAAADATRSSSALPLRPDALDAATRPQFSSEPIKGSFCELSRQRDSRGQRG